MWEVNTPALIHSNKKVTFIKYLCDEHFLCIIRLNLYGKKTLSEKQTKNPVVLCLGFQKISINFLSDFSFRRTTEFLQILNTVLLEENLSQSPVKIFISADLKIITDFSQ